MKPRKGICAAMVLLAPYSVLGGQSAAELQARGTEAFRAGQFAVAERLFSQLVKENPSAPAFSYLAACEGAEGKYEQAIAHFRRSIQLGNDTPTLHYNLALAYLKDNQLKPGIRELQLALNRQPNYTEARYALGVAMVDAGQGREALTNLEKVRTLLSKDPGFWTNLVRAYFQAGDGGKAVHTIDEATAAFPDNTRLSAGLAEVCIHYRQPQKARELLENASELAPTDDRVKLLLAQASLEAEEPVEALAVLKDLPSSAGAPGQLAFLRGRAFMLGGKPKDAEPLLASAVNADPKNLEYLSTYAELQTSLEDYDGALASLGRAQQMHPNSPEFPYERALIYTFTNEYPKAAAECQNATRLDSTFDQAYFLLGAIEFEQGDSRGAEDAFQHAAILKSQVALYHSALGAALFQGGRTLAGKQELDRSLALDPHTPSAYYWRAQVYTRQNQPAMAISDLETFVALEPNYPEAYERLAALYTAQGQGAKAEESSSTYNSLKQKMGPKKVPFFLAQLGQMRFRETRAPLR